ncbi:MAG TPA: dienelactone hydrolase family protein, partial [Kribbellaceae bacterium]|nr:dienelactone hydrolase family protein [Kribbellaceae bacterium]
MFAGPRGPLLAAWTAAAKPRGGVLVIHENRGLNEHIRTVAGRLAASGYSALALDLLSEEGGTGAFPGEAEVAAGNAQVPPERFVADMRASLTELKRRVRNKKLRGGQAWIRSTSWVAAHHRADHTTVRRFRSARSHARRARGARVPRFRPRRRFAEPARGRLLAALGFPLGDHHGTALHTAAVTGRHLEVVEVLLELGADPGAEADDEGLPGQV